MTSNLQFVFPEIIIIWIVLSVFLSFVWWKSEKKASMKSSHNSTLLDSYGQAWQSSLQLGLIFLIVVLLSCIIAQPYKIYSNIEIEKDGIDIVIVMDVSKSMDFPDFQPSRMQVAKSLLSDFVTQISSDRLGLIVFSGQPISSQPLSFDFALINDTITRLSSDIIDQDIRGLSGTNMGDALLLSQWLFDTDDREKVVIMITDGDANIWADPRLVAQLLAQDNIRVYPIGIWKNSPSSIEVSNWFFQQTQEVPPLNIELLQAIADQTKGIFFQAEDAATLSEVFAVLKQLQTTTIKSQISQSHTAAYTLFLYILLLCFAVLVFIELRYPKCK